MEVRDGFGQPGDQDEGRADAPGLQGGARGGTGQASLTTDAVLVGNGTSAVQLISPLNVGTGVKNKVLEAMAFSKVVIGSELSFDGIDIVDGEHAIIAKEPNNYIENI